MSCHGHVNKMLPWFNVVLSGGQSNGDEEALMKSLVVFFIFFLGIV